VDVTSLGNRTDLALLQLGGTQVEDRGDHLVVRSPHNPTFWWGNFLLLSQVPPAADTDGWLERFATEFPEAAHVALAFDGVDGRVEDLAAFTERGLRCEASTVMGASVVAEPPRPNREATYRQLTSDDDWAQSVELRVACNDEQEEAAYREFATLKVATNRALTEAGHGGWFGAFLDGALLSQMGLFSASPGLARFQSVETHPDARGQGLAGTLVHSVSQYGFGELGATTLVMVADPDDNAIRLYRSVGFADGESQLQAERPPVVGAQITSRQKASPSGRKPSPA
jgi:ribosomal protein S18 acetylase RimI-like enzyme